MVGEKGPELIRMRGGEQVVPNHALRGYAGGTTGWDITDTFKPPMGIYLASLNRMAANAQDWIIRQVAKNAVFSGAFGGGGLGAGPGGPVEAVARALFPWAASQWPSFNYVEMREAGYNLNARNPTSGAFGVAQFINGPSEYFQWGGNPFTAAGQFTGMYNYIASRYINPANAAAHEMAFNWYDSGQNYLPPGLSLAMNGTGRPERVGGAGGTTIVIQNLNVTAQDPAALVAGLQAYVHRNGPIKLKIRS